MCVRAHVHAVRREVHFTRDARTRTHALSPSFLRLSALHKRFGLSFSYIPPSLFLRIERENREYIRIYTNHEETLAHVFLVSTCLCLSPAVSLSPLSLLFLRMHASFARSLARLLARALACAWKQCHPSVGALLPSLRPSFPQRVPCVRAPAECSAAVFNRVLRDVTVNRRTKRGYRGITRFK